MIIFILSVHMIQINNKQLSYVINTYLIINVVGYRKKIYNIPIHNNYNNVITIYFNKTFKVKMFN